MGFVGDAIADPLTGIVAAREAWRHWLGGSSARIGLSMSSIAAMALAPRIMARLGPRGLWVAGLCLALAFACPLLPRGVAGFGIAMALVGASVSLLDIGANMDLSKLEARHDRHLMNFSHAMFSFAFAASALVASLMRSAGQPASVSFALLCAVTLILVLAMRQDRDWAPEAAAPEGSGRGRPWGPIGMTAAILFVSFVSENTAETWSALHVERTLGGAVGHGGFGPVALGLTMGLGRLAGQLAARRLGEAGLVLWSAILGVAGGIVIALAPVPLVAILGVGLLGLGVAVIVPSANSILGRLVRPDQRGHAISRAWMIGFTGFFIGPSAMGLISQAAGLRMVFLAVAALLATIVPLILAMKRRSAAAQL
jgi:MFS family permease